ncbi:chlorohydrolase family protein [Paenarthrobacter sp. NPDC092416]|uniref:chlorohydrolase family protein n=1 Tax=Paenarthrobacter sp. NPDC092416 TaxID=3364386 RepID=UPI0037FEA280
MKTRIAGKYVIGFNDGDHVIYEDGCVIYDNEHIVYVGANYDGEVDENHEMGLSIISPGFIDLDALADIDHALLDCWATGTLAAGYDWSEKYAVSGPVDVFTAEERQLIREYALQQLVLNGVTTAMPIAAEAHSSWAESFDDFAAVTEIAERLGLRMYLGPSYRAGVNVVAHDGTRKIHWDHDKGSAGLKDAVRFLEYLNSRKSPLLRGCLLPARIETLTPELLRGTALAAEEANCLVRLHCLQEETELSFLGQSLGRTPLEILDEYGLLNERLLIPHALYVGGVPFERDRFDSELQLLKTSGVTVINCPLTSIRNGKALRSFGTYRAAGVNLAIGSDSFPPDLITGMSYGTNIAKLLDGNQAAGNPGDYFRAATLGGAKALQRNDLGRLEPGCLADIIVVDLNSIRTGIPDDPIRTLVMNCSGRDVGMSVIHGRMVMKNGQILAPSPTDLHQRALHLFEKMKAAYPRRDFLNRPTRELFPASFEYVR